MPQASIADYATYLLYGLEAGVLSEENARDWAFSIIDQETEPSSEIIEVAMSHGKERIFTALKAISQDASATLAGSWLLGLLKEELKSHPEKIERICRKALQIARATKQPDSIYYELDGIDDEIYLAKVNTYGTLNDCLQHLTNALAPYGGVST